MNRGEALVCNGKTQDATNNIVSCQHRDAKVRGNEEPDVGREERREHAKQEHSEFLFKQVHVIYLASHGVSDQYTKEEGSTELTDSCNHDHLP